MTTQTVTELQAAMLRKIARSEFTSVNGAEPTTPLETQTWANQIIMSPQDKGVFTSLLKEGLVQHEGDGSNATVRLTDSGFDVYFDVYKSLSEKTNSRSTEDSKMTQDLRRICTFTFANGTTLSAAVVDTWEDGEQKQFETLLESARAKCWLSEDETIGRGRVVKFEVGVRVVC